MPLPLYWAENSTTTTSKYYASLAPTHDQDLILHTDLTHNNIILMKQFLFCNQYRSQRKYVGTRYMFNTRKYFIIN